jgi:nucleotide-binding universal stress UspA family protein
MAKKQILVPVDFSPQQDAVIARAVSLAKILEAELVLLHCATPLDLNVVVVEPIYLPALMVERFAGEHMSQASQKLEELAAELGSESTRPRCIVKSTDPVAGILAVAEEIAADYIVMGSHGAGFDRFLLGSVAEKVSRLATCPVVVARDEDQSELRQVVVGIDFSPRSRALVRMAQEITDPTGQIHLLHCWQPPHLDTMHLFGAPGHASLVSVLSDGMQQHVAELENFVAILPDDERYQLHVMDGRPAHCLLELGEEVAADAIVVGAHNAESVQNLLGSVADRVLRHARTTVLLTERAAVS